MALSDGDEIFVAETPAYIFLEDVRLRRKVAINTRYVEAFWSCLDEQGEDNYTTIQVGKAHFTVNVTYDKCINLIIKPLRDII